MRFLAAHPDKAFTQSEIRDATGVKAGSISVVLSRLEERGLVRHKGTYWALGDDDEAAAYTSMADTGGCKFVKIFPTPGWRITSVCYSHQYEWLDHAVDEGEK